MATFVLPKNSRIGAGQTYKAPAGATNTKNFSIYRWNPDDGQNPRIDTYELDMADQPAYGKTRPLRAGDFAAFEAAYGDDPNGAAAREDGGIEGRFRSFTRAKIEARADNLDISWLRGSDEAGEDALEEPEDILDAMRTHLARALAEVDALAGEFGDEQAIAAAS